MTKICIMFGLSILLYLTAYTRQKSLNHEDFKTNVQVINGVSIPSDFPLPEIFISENPHNDKIFLNTWHSAPYIMIMNNQGIPLFYKKMTGRAYDFKVQPTGILTHFIRDPLWAFIAMDTNYTVIDTIQCGNELRTDEHELQILENGHALIFANDPREIDMSQIVENGHPSALVSGDRVQELDINKNVIFEWSCWDHFEVTDAEYEDLTAASIDFTHMNALDVDLDGQIVISSRNLSEITKINKTTGAIIWRFGGKNNEFTLMNDPHGFSYQHSIRVLPNGNYILFDNGNQKSPHYSRAVEYQLDTDEMIATKVWEYRHTPDCVAGYLGNVQRLSNGNTLINWAYPNTPKLTEVTPNGNIAFEFDFHVPTYTYRTFRCDWSGKAAVPYLLIEANSNHITLLFNKFGDQDISEYQIYGAISPHPVELIATSTQSYIQLSSELQNEQIYYFRVRTLNSQGELSGYSNEEEIFVNLTTPGMNMIRNGDFTDGFDSWEWRTSGSANANWSITEDKQLFFNIDEGGAFTQNIQARQSNIQLVQNRSYLLEFYAYANASKTIEVEIKKEVEPYTNYSQMGLTFLNQIPQHFSHNFVMDHPSEIAAQIVLNVGGSDEDVYIDNISLKDVTSAVSEEMESRPQKFALSQNYPNPFNPRTRIQYAIPRQSHVTLSIYNIRGKHIQKLVDQFQDTGTFDAWMTASNLGSGIYFYTLSARSPQGGQLFHQTKKMMILK